MHEHVGDKWRMVDHRPEYRPANPGVKPASWKRLDGKRDVEMRDHWQTRKRDDAHWNGSEKGFAVRLDMNLEMEVEIRGTINGDITLSAEALYVSPPCGGFLLREIVMNANECVCVCVGIMILARLPS